MTAHPPTPESVNEAIPETIQRLLRYPNVALTKHQCPLSTCEERLVFTGTEHTDITDDAGYITGHAERQTFRCFGDHRVHERGPKLDIDTPQQQ